MMSNETLLWLDLHRTAYFWLAGGLLSAALMLAVGPLLLGREEIKGRHDWWWGLLSVAILAAGRWPTFLITREFSSDESQLLAGGRALLQDPVFWRSVDGASSGPLNFFALCPAGLLFGWDSYVPARFTALALLAVTLVLAHQCMALALGRRVARVTILAAVGLEALTNAVDLLHYSTELMPMALLVAAVYAAIRRWFHRGGLGWNGLGGLLLGAAPLAKLQVVPMAAALGLSWLVAEFLTRGEDAGRRRIYLLAGAVTPAALFAAQITAAGEWWNVILPYFFYNIRYTTAGSFPFPKLMELMWQNASNQDSLLHLWLPGSIGWILLMLRPRQSLDRTTRIFTLAALPGALLGFYSVIYPGRPFPHYWQMSVVPFTFLLGATTASLLSQPARRWRRRERWLVAACALALVGVLLQHRFRNLNTYIGAFTYFREHPRTELATHVAAHARPGEAIAIWGWSSYVYIEADLWQATRDAHFERAVAPGAYQEYFRQRFLADLIHAKPALFLDSAGPCSLRYIEAKYRHDQSFPALAALIHEQYRLVDEVSGARLYRRLDLTGH